MNKSLKGFLVGAMLAVVVTSSTAACQIKQINNELEKTQFNLKLVKEKHNETSKHADKKEEENKKITEELEKVKKENAKLNEDKKELQKELATIRNFELTYYTDLPEENGGYTITSSQTKLRHGVVASNFYPVGTKILINGCVYTVEDTGSSEFNSPHRLDVLVERHPGEDDDTYLNRVNNKGRVQVKGKIL